jgi:hypothetical protein
MNNSLEHVSAKQNFQKKLNGNLFMFRSGSKVGSGSGQKQSGSATLLVLFQEDYKVVSGTAQTSSALLKILQ